MKFVNSTLQDVDFIFQLFDSAIAYQKKKGYDLWPKFSRDMIETEIEEKRHWKIIENGNIVCILSVVYDDPIIWGEDRNNQPSVYLHRITINPDFKGKGIMNVIREWAIEHAKENDKRFVRMDTWGKNENLRNYYINSGFPYIGQQYLQEAEGLAKHYGGAELSLFEIEVK